MAHFTPTEVISLFPSASRRNYSAGQIVIYQGDQPNHIFFVVRGALKYYDIDETGTEKIMQVVGEHSFFSILSAFGESQEVTGFYSTLDDCEVLMIDLVEFKNKLSSDNVLSMKFLRWFTGEVDYLVQRVRGLERNDAQGKVLEALDYLASRHGKVRATGWTRVKFPFSQQAIADLSGLSRETVSAVFKEIDELKVVRTPKQLRLEIHHQRLKRHIQ